MPSRASSITFMTLLRSVRSFCSYFRAAASVEVRAIHQRKAGGGRESVVAISSCPQNITLPTWSGVSVVADGSAASN